MKYRLLKEIPNCNWIVGEVREADSDVEIKYYCTSELANYIEPHEIVLLIHCGFLEEVKEEPMINCVTKMTGEDLKEKLWVEVMEDYIKTAEFGHYARDEEEHYKEMRRHLNKLVEFIQSNEKTICDHKWEVTLTDKKQFNHCTECNKCEVVIR